MLRCTLDTKFVDQAFDGRFLVRECLQYDLAGHLQQLSAGQPIAQAKTQRQHIDEKAHEAPDLRHGAIGNRRADNDIALVRQLRQEQGIDREERDKGGYVALACERLDRSGQTAGKAHRDATTIMRARVRSRAARR